MPCSTISFRLLLLLVFTCCCVETAQAQQAPERNEQGSLTTQDTLTTPASPGQPGENLTGRNSSLENEKVQTERQKLKLETNKVNTEIQKLEAEIQSLKITNEALDARVRWLSAWLGAIGGVAGGVLVPLLLWRLNSNFKSAQLGKLKQEKELEREKHNMELFQNLGHENLRVQLAAASALTQRLENFHSSGADLSQAEQLEKRTIIQVLIAVSKKNDEDAAGHSERKISLGWGLSTLKKNAQDASAHPAFLKLIADNLVRAMGAIVEDGKGEERKRPATKTSPLQDFDFQKVQFPNAYWRGVDARNVDFFRADLSNAGLAEIFLTEAVLMKANLSGTVLRGADLRKANLCDANLRGADLSEARRKKPVVEDVKIPTDLREADLRGADLSGAKLEGAQFDGAKVAGAKLTGAALGNNPTGQVDCSSAGDGSQMRSIQAWLNSTLPV